MLLVGSQPVKSVVAKPSTTGRDERSLRRRNYRLLELAPSTDVASHPCLRGRGRLALSHSRSGRRSGHGALGGAVLGGILGVAALAIPRVGPLAAAGAIASGASPGAIGAGAGAGAVAGGLTILLRDHGVDENDASYYEDRIKQGGTFVSVRDDGSFDRERAREILYRNGGHNSSQERMVSTH